MQITAFDKIDFTKDAFWRVEITPEIADKCLGRNVKNNRQTKRRRSQYAKDMKNGKWVVGTGETIKFDKDGNLFDGQNRMHAVIMANTTVLMDVKTGADVSAMFTVDDIAARTSADAIKIAFNCPNYNDVASISGAVQLLHNGAYNLGTHTGNVAPTRQEIVEFAGENMDVIQEWIATARRATSTGIKNMGIKGWFACVWLTSLMNKDMADEYYASVCAGDGVATSFVEDALLPNPQTGKPQSGEWLRYKYVRSFDRDMMGNRVRIGGGNSVADAYRKIWNNYVDNMREKLDTGFKFISD